MAEERALWYVIHTYSGYEAMVKDSLEKLIENNNLQEKIVDIQIPTEETLEEKANGKKKIVERKKYPCYVFLKMVYSNDVWWLVTNTRGVTSFVGTGGRPLPLSLEEVARIGLDRRVEVADFAVGDTVQIIAGALESYTATIIALNDETQIAKVNVMFANREQAIDVEYVQIKKIDKVVPSEQA